MATVTVPKGQGGGKGFLPITGLASGLVKADVLATEATPPTSIIAIGGPRAVPQKP